MKLTILISFIFLFGTCSALWSACPGSNAPGPDSVTSPNCCAVRCVVERGGMLYATIHVTFQSSHKNLRTKVTAFWLGFGEKML